MKMIGGRYAQVLMLFVLVGSLFAIGCAAKVAPIEDISRAEMAIKEAQESNGEMYAPLELRLAEDKFSQAKKAMAEEEYDTAKRFADEALMDAKLAEAKSLSAKARKLSKEMSDSIETLRREIQRLQHN